MAKRKKTPGLSPDGSGRGSSTPGVARAKYSAHAWKLHQKQLETRGGGEQRPG